MIRTGFRYMIKWLELFLLVFFITVVLVLLIPRIFLISQHVVLSGSMEPAIPTGSLCYLSHRVDVDEIRIGQIIGYQRPDGSLVIHRVTKIEEDAIYTKGDANDQEDLAPVQKKDYYGMVVYSIPYLGYLTAFLQERHVYIILCMMAVLLFLLDRHSSREKGEVRNE